MQELAPTLIKSTHIAEPMLETFRAHYQDSRYWTSVITFMASWGQKAA
jgi:hypothetical protein